VVAVIRTRGEAALHGLATSEQRECQNAILLFRITPTHGPRCAQSSKHADHHVDGKQNFR
jgi:hypothetical protein